MTSQEEGNALLRNFQREREEREKRGEEKVRHKEPNHSDISFTN